MTEKREYATRAEAEADTSFGADPRGSIGAILFALAFVVGAILLGIALANNGEDPQEWEGTQYVAERDCGYPEGSLEHQGYDSFGTFGDAWIFEAPDGKRVLAQMDSPGVIDCDG